VSSPDSPARPSARPAEAAPQAFDVDQPVDADGLYGLRETLAAHASRLGAGEETIDHLLIVASELATNAVRHGGGTGHVRLWHRGQLLFCQVSDHGPGISDPTVGTILPAPTTGDGGRGLWICRRLTTELTIETGPDGHGTIITAAIAA
jgi:anti-sigma regulatory factor (Ser/Thr protein kinase)